MENATHWQLLVAIVGAVVSMIGSFVIGTWVLSNKISENHTSLANLLATHVGEAKVRDERITDLRKDVEDHEIRLRTVETGEALREFVKAAHKMSGKTV